MRTSHCPKTYQLAAVEVANSACFRPFLRKNPRIGAFRGIISPSADAPSAPAGRPRCSLRFGAVRGHAAALSPEGRRRRHPAAGGPASGVRRRVTFQGRRLWCVDAGSSSRLCGRVLVWPAGSAGACVKRRRDLREGVWGLNAGEPQPGGWGSRPCNDVPAVTYSPTPSRVQYHRRCGS